MLPSKGYFSEIPCVFYLGDGCGRPCCHYRHSQQDVKNGQDFRRAEDEVSEQIKSLSADQINLVSKLVEKAVNRVFLEEPSKNLKVDKSEMVRATLNKLLSDNQAIKWAQKGLKDAEVPSYEPTPIAKLNNRHIPVVCVPEKPIIIPSKGIKALSSNCSNSTDTGVTTADYTYRGRQWNLGGDLSINTRWMDDASTRVDEDILNTFIDSGESSNHSRTVETPFSPPSNIESQDPIHDTDLPSAQLHPSANMMEFYTENTQSNESYTPLHSSSDDIVIQSGVHYPTIYHEPEQNLGYSNTRREVLNNDLLPRCYGDRDFLHAHEERIFINKTTSKQNNYDTLTSRKSDSKFTECGHKNVKKCLSLKHHKPKTHLLTEGSKLTENYEKSASLKRSNEDKTREHSAKKLKVSTSNEVADNSGSSAEQPRALDMNCPTSEAPMPNSHQVRGLEVSRSISYEKGKNGLKLSSKNNFHITSTGDPFSRWMKNKKLREILSKKTLKQTTNLSMNDKKFTKYNYILEIRDDDSEPLPAPKFTERVAHKKDEIRPSPVVLDSIKIPLAYRQYFCDAFFQEFRKTLSVEEAKSEAQKKELDVAKTSGVKSYKNNGSLQLIKLRKHGCLGEPKVAQNVMLDPSSCPDFTYGWSLYKCFSKYVMTEDEARDNGYPFPIPGKPNCAFIEKSARKYSMEQPSKPSVKICANCSTEFRIGNDGVPVTKDDCFYHWGRLRKVISMGQWIDKYTCCDGLDDSVPCESSSYHVWSGRNEDCMEDFVETPKLPSYMKECDAGIYALDCEMCYTTKGLELARLTVIDLNEDVVFDQVVSLDSPVLDYCTRFSGIDETKIRQATYRFADIRAWVLDHFYDKTILLGHSLDNDLKALKLIHKTVIDTSVTFPHKFGPPNKMSLKHLASSLLKISIQEDAGGHDSKEDAATCLKLMMMKIRDDCKVRKPRIIIGYSGKKR